MKPLSDYFQKQLDIVVNKAIDCSPIKLSKRERKSKLLDILNSSALYPYAVAIQIEREYFGFRSILDLRSEIDMLEHTISSTESYLNKLVSGSKPKSLQTKYKEYCTAYTSTKSALPQNIVKNLKSIIPEGLLGIHSSDIVDAVSRNKKMTFKRFIEKEISSLETRLAKDSKKYEEDKVQELALTNLHMYLVYALCRNEIISNIKDILATKAKQVCNLLDYTILQLRYTPTSLTLDILSDSITEEFKLSMSKGLLNILLEGFKKYGMSDLFKIDINLFSTEDYIRILSGKPLVKDIFNHKEKEYNSLYNYRANIFNQIKQFISDIDYNITLTDVSSIKATKLQQTSGYNTLTKKALIKVYYEPSSGGISSSKLRTLIRDEFNIHNFSITSTSPSPVRPSNSN